MARLVSKERVYKFLREEGPRLPWYQVNAHGRLGLGWNNGAPKYFRVPPHTAVALFSVPGTLVAIDPRKAHKEGVHRVPNSVFKQVLRGDLSPGRVHGYITLYVAGDMAPDHEMDFADRGDAVGHVRNVKQGTMYAPRGPFKRTRDPAGDQRTLRLSQLLKRTGPGLYLVFSCRGAYVDPKRSKDPAVRAAARAMEVDGMRGPQHMTPARRKGLSRAQRADLLARARLFRTTRAFNHRYAQAAAPNLHDHSHVLLAIAASPGVRTSAMRNVTAMQRSNGRRSMAGNKVDAAHRYQLRKHGLNTHNERTRVLLRKYGFDTPDEERAQRLYIHHKTRAHGQAKHDEIDAAFAIRRSR